MSFKKQPMLFKAIEFATKAHSGQFRKAGRIPYIIHPLAVAQILIEHDCSEDIVVAGVLHDTVEDTQVTLHDIRSEFGDRVAELVAGASEQNKWDTWENRKRAMLRSLQGASQDLLILVCADKLDNIRSIRKDQARVGEGIWERFNRSKDRQRWYFQSMLDVFTQKLTTSPGRSLCEQFRYEVESVFVNDLTR